MHRWTTSATRALLIVAGALLGAADAAAQVTRGDGAALLALLRATWSDRAQTPPGAFEGLLPADQKVARALFQAQKANAPKRLGLDQIAAPKRSGEGWGEVFRTMKARGLVADKNLGQVLSRFDKTHRGGRSK
jgi:hypothetical protein